MGLQSKRQTRTHPSHDHCHIPCVSFGSLVNKEQICNLMAIQLIFIRPFGSRSYRHLHNDLVRSPGQALYEVGQVELSQRLHPRRPE